MIGASIPIEVLHDVAAAEEDVPVPADVDELLLLLQPAAASAPSAAAAKITRLLIGPWYHRCSGRDKRGTQSFGYICDVSHRSAIAAREPVG